MSMAEMASMDNYWFQPGGDYAPHEISYGTIATAGTTTWDADVFYGCVCDSAWPVGFGPNETQLSQYFGPDCSLRECVNHMRVRLA